MPFCAKCGLPLPEESRFCNRCGTQSSDSSLAGRKIDKMVPVSARPPQTTGAVSDCRYHCGAAVVGSCVDCENGFCQDCAVEIVRHGTVCLDCGARFARRKLIQAYIAAGLGLVTGLVIASQAASENNWAFAITAPIIYMYLFPAVFFGWHYGGKIWKALDPVSDHFSGVVGLGITFFVLSVRLFVAVFLGAFGGGIMQYLNYRQIINLQHDLSALPVAQAA